MGNILVTNNYQTPSAAIYSTQNASFPATNVLTLCRPYRRWKATDITTSEWIGLDLGSAKAVDCVFVNNINVNAIYIEADAAATFDSNAGQPDYTTGIVTVSRDYSDDRYKYVLYNEGATLFTKRYLRVRSAVTNVTDSETVLACGEVTAFVGCSNATSNPGHPLLWTPRLLEINSAIAGRPYCDLSLSYQMAKVAMKTELLQWAQEYRSKPVFVYLNAGNTQEGYMGHIVGDVSVGYQKLNLLTGGQIVFREYGGEAI